MGWTYEQYPQSGRRNGSAQVDLCAVRKQGSVVIATLPFFALFLPSDLVNIITVLALGATKVKQAQMANTPTTVTNEPFTMKTSKFLSAVLILESGKTASPTARAQ